MVNSVNQVSEAGDPTAAALRAGIAASSYAPPAARPGVVARDDLVKQLIDVPPEQIVVVAAPAGYGKTTTMALWDATDERDFAWVHLGPPDNDPVHLLRHTALAIDSLEPIDSRSARKLTEPGRTPELDMVPALLEALEDREPFVLVFDDLHVLTSEAALRCVMALATCGTGSCHVALVGRAAPHRILARQSMGALVFELSASDLSMGAREAALLLDTAGVHLEEEDVEELVRRTEGWPGGLYLAGLALARGGPDAHHTLFSDRDRLVADYLVEEVLRSQRAEVVEFLERSAILERMNAPLLDELFERDDSGNRLTDIEESDNLFLIPLDDERNWYRYHHLFGEMLRERLHQRDPELARLLNQRASLLLEQQGDIDGSISHAMAAADSGRAADLVLARTMALVFGGRVALLGQWLALVGIEAIDRHVSAAIAWAWWAASTGDVDLLKRATAAAEGSTEEGPLSDGSPFVAVAVAILRATEGWDGLEGVIRDTQLARNAGGPSSNPWWVFATVIQGTARSMRGELDLAREQLYAALEAMTDAPALEAATIAHLALIAVYESDLPEADRLASRAFGIMERFELKRVLPAISVYPICALVAARCGRPDDARRAAASAREMLVRLDYLSPRSALQANLLLAKTALALGDRAQARESADEAERAQRREPSASYLTEQLQELRAQLETGQDERLEGSPPITTAELRVLGYLPTHLSLQDIAEQLLISRNTAKSHSVAIYRKLGVSSRRDAVSEARRVGILTD